jgi:hypothetical protein
MTRSRLFNSVDYLATGNYALWAESGRKTAISPDTPEYFAWLDTLPSFHFKGKHGHFTARQEQGYWYAYRKAKKRQFKRYLGTTDKLTVPQLERIADQLAQVIAAEPEPPAAKRRKIAETKENLRDRVKQLERTVEQQRTRIQQLEDELTSLKKAHAMENYNRIMRERRSWREE